MGVVLNMLSKKPSSDELWNEVSAFLILSESPYPTAIVDAELKMILFAAAMTTSPNFPGPSRELLVAQFYVNEAHYAHEQLQ